ncbi:unnamed protein product, partial [Nesidiocoris tenuis]
MNRFIAFFLIALLFGKISHAGPVDLSAIAESSDFRTPDNQNSTFWIRPRRGIGSFRMTLSTWKSSALCPQHDDGLCDTSASSVTKFLKLK